MFHRSTAALAALSCVAALAATVAGTGALSSALAQDRACAAYARDAVSDARRNRARRCGFSGRLWSTDYRRHYRWCRAADRAARRRASRQRNRMLRRCAARRGDERGRDRGRDRGGDRVCTREYRPVCAVRQGQRRTYPNACEARNDGVRIVRPGRCRGARPDPGPGPGGGRACRLRGARVTVSSPGCSPKSKGIPFRRRALRHGQSVVLEVNSGTIGRGYQPWGVCNFHTRLRYTCRNGRLRITREFRCQQARTNPRAADCSVDN